MNHLKNLSERVMCPFDPVHVVERRRFQAHLIKCKRNLPKNHDFVQCPYWHLHYVRRSEMNDHFESCEHKLEKEANKKIWDAETQPKFFQPKLMFNEVLPATELENWDDITQTAPHFSADIMRAKANYMTVPQGLTKSKRKDFRDRERERLREKEFVNDPKMVEVKGEKKKDLVEPEAQPPPRKPIENPVQRLGRIAAKFPTQKGPEEKSNETFSSIAYSNRRNETGNTPVIGRGRGLLGWSHVAEPERAYRFSSDDFPKL
ncbi:putative D7 protein [Daphnia magna]|uniref:Uncharacterized protein n=2 Tax=Daphnia magna TaxID=35525 RepID=A0ABQ9Z6D6_9CRUS|nr:hypothetical protein OUZ56_013608 [Daphnia magna]KZS04023.1 putative D7 protein [Daphnia magna]